MVMAGPLAHRIGDTDTATAGRQEERRRAVAIGRAKSSAVYRYTQPARTTIGTRIRREVATATRRAVIVRAAHAVRGPISRPATFIETLPVAQTNTFTDIVASEDNADRRSGVWVVNIENGETIAILKFGAAVEEVFAVQTVPGSLFPEIIDEANEVVHSTWVLPEDAYKEIRAISPETSS
jgi:hypothetical protein